MNGPIHELGFSDLPTNTLERPTASLELSDFAACEAVDSGHRGVSFLMKLTGADEAACQQAIGRAERLGLVYTLGEGTALLDEPGKRYLQEQRLTADPARRQRVAETQALMDLERRQREEERERVFRESRRWWRFMDGETVDGE